MDLGSQIVLTSNTGEFRVDFREQLNIKGTKIGFKALHHPRLFTPHRYAFYVKDEDELIETVVLPRLDYNHYDTEGLLYDMHDAFEEYLAEKHRAGGITGYHLLNVEHIGNTTTLRFPRSYRIVKKPDLIWTSSFILSTDIFDLIPSELVTLSNRSLKIKYHVFPEEVDRLDLVYLTCDIIKSNYVDDTKEHILEVLTLSSAHEINVIQKENPVFFDVCVDEIITINVSIKSFDGYDLYFTELFHGDLVLVLQCQNSS